MKRRVLAIVLALGLIGSMTACGSKKEEPTYSQTEVDQMLEEMEKETEELKKEIEKETEELKKELEKSTEELTDVEETPAEEAAPEPAAEEPAPEPAPAEETNKADNSAIRPEIKEAIDSYEAFVDDYCDFMKKADLSDFKVLTEYTELLGKELEMTAKFDALEDEDLTDAEYNYYTEVSLRCLQKLSNVADSM
ncbi:MAG: hypothetical protein Q4B73_08385 [Lachnospiraceae bacterium]|nr:hypothetical protein [Lachnospiraceae bacterium]